MLTVDFNLFQIRDGQRVLDVGCGLGRHSWEACRRDHCAVYAMDIDLESLQKAKYMLYLMEHGKEAKGELNVIQGDALSLPFKDASFDKVICSEVLEHLAEDEQAVRELVRVLKYGGELAVSVPAYLIETIYWGLSKDYHSNPGGHIKIYRERELISLLRCNNLSVYAIRHKHALHSIYWLLRCLCGIKKEKALLASLYHKFLTWEITNKSRFIQRVESLLDFVFPKSIVIYLKKAPER